MIVDVHSHLFHYPEHFSKDFIAQTRRARSGVEIDLTVRWEEYHAHAKQCDKTIVFGGKAKLSGEASLLASVRQKRRALAPSPTSSNMLSWTVSGGHLSPLP